MDQIIINDLQACVNCLGSMDGGKFVRDVDTNVSIRDILRHLHRESNKCEIRLELSNMNVIQRYLFPLLIDNNDDEVLFELIIRLMMNLTQPAFVCFKQQLPDDMMMRVIYIQVNESLQKYKIIFANHAVLSLLANCLNNIFEKEWENRSEEDHMMVERVLILIRNVLHINTSDVERNVIDGSWSYHDKLLTAMLECGWTEIVVYLANTDDEHRFAFHILEIVSLIFKEQTAETMKQSITKTNICKDEDTNQLLQLVKLEEERENKARATLNLRGLRYDGFFELPNIKSTSGLPMVYHHDLSSGDLNLSRDRKLRHKPRHRQAIMEATCERKSAKKTLEKLQDFCILFLNHGYNTLMNTARNFLVRQQMQADDETYYLWSLKFFSSVCRVGGLSPELVSETMSEEVFHWVYGQIIQYKDNGETEKKKCQGWYRKMQLALSAFNEMLRMLLMMDKHSDKKYNRLSVHIKNSVFYREEYLEMYPDLLRKFKESVQSRALLQALIEGSYLVISILQNHKSFDMNVVRKIKKKRKHPKKKETKTSIEVNEEVIMPNDNEEELKLLWSRICEEITSAVKGEIALPEEDTLPNIYDSTLPDQREPIEPGSEPVDIQLKKALSIVQIYLRQGKVALAVAVLRLARAMWPDEDRIVLDSEKDSSDQEIAMLKMLMFAPIFYTEEDLEVIKKPMDAVMDEEEEYDDNEEEYDLEEAKVVTKEILFDLTQYLLKFTDPNIVKTYGIIFQQFHSNPQSTNMSILRLMHRIAVKLKLPVVLYNLRLFKAFRDFIKSPLSKMEVYKDERKFVLYIIKHFCQHTVENRKLFIELIFPKNTKHLMCILKGEKYEVADKGPKWTESLDEELERLVEEVIGEPVLPGVDVINTILNKFSDSTKTRRQVVGRLINLGLMETIRDLCTYKRKRPEIPWGAEEQARLIVLFDEYKDEKNPMRIIMNGMKTFLTEADNVRSRREVVKKILELGLVDNKEELGIVSRPRKNKGGKNESDDDDESDKENDNEEEGQLEDLVIHREKRVPPPPKVNTIIDWTAFKMTFARLSEDERNWFVELLVDNIDSRNNGIIGNLSFIPLLDEDFAALSSLTMQKLFDICKFLYPDDNKGENFWRIPEHMGAKQLDHYRHCATSLTAADLVALTMTETEEKEKSIPKKPLQQINLKAKDLFGSESEEEVEKNIGKRISMFESDEDEDDDEDNGDKREEKKDLMRSNSEDEEDGNMRKRKSSILSENVGNEVEMKKKTIETFLESESEEDTNINIKRRMFDSEEEYSDDEVKKSTSSKNIKRRRTIIEDDSD